jgi:hypothetical protein
MPPDVKSSFERTLKMLRKNLAILSASLLLLSGLCSCTVVIKPVINITDAKIVTGTDENLMPIKEMDVFPKGTSKVSCWIKWQDARINTQLLAKWYYVTDDIHILDHVFNIPKKDGTGSVVLSMPEGKVLPSGSYRLDLVLEKRTLKSLTFKIE